ncbi:hypothetical protein BC831DRAFT_516098 [Entophlyctis helioformis]|nr:hypothetical protein BC831DRAFT_516098 [Entophlyctis helioformis]
MSSKPFASLTFSELGLDPHRQSLTVIPPDTSIRSALETLARLRLINLPIASHDNPAKVFAVVSILDVLAFIIGKSDSSSSSSDHAANAAINERLDKPVEMVLTLDPDDESYMVFERDWKDSIEATLKAFASGLHRALITDTTNAHPPILLGQSDILRFIATCQSPPAYAIDIHATPVSAILSRHALVSIRESHTALQAYRHLVSSGVSSAPVVDESGSVVAAISAKDLRSLGVSLEYSESTTLKGILADLSRPVLEFLKTTQSKGLKPATVAKDTSVLDAVRAMVDGHHHHVWVVDGGRLTGVVSQSDVIGVCINGLPTA